MLNANTYVTVGTDPEAFFKVGGEVIGSELIIPSDGLRTNGGKVVRDGVQFEINPHQAYTTDQLGKHLSIAFQALTKHAKQVDPNAEFCFEGLVEVSKKQLERLSPSSQILGCQPSRNIYGHRPITVDAVRYRKRSAGGHIHLGLTGPIYEPNSSVDERDRLVPLLDIFVGNTSVMLDRDPGAKERRKNYGRAGEHRQPSHGLEYRTTSNYWLQGYPLMSFVFGMAKLCVAILGETINGNNLEQELIDTVDIRRVIRAININDYDLARRNFEVVVPFLHKHLPRDGFPLNTVNMHKFLEFADVVNQRGLEPFFPKADIVKRWCNAEFVEFTQYLEQL